MNGLLGAFHSRRMPRCEVSRTEDNCPLRLPREIRLGAVSLEYR